MDHPPAPSQIPSGTSAAAPFIGPRQNPTVQVNDLLAAENKKDAPPVLAPSDVSKAKKTSAVLPFSRKAFVAGLIGMSLIVSFGAAFFWGTPESSFSSEAAFIEATAGSSTLEQDFSTQSLAAGASVIAAPGMRIVTAESATAAIHFPAQEEVRIFPGSSVTVTATTPTPILTLDTGEIWIHAQSGIQVHYKNYTFAPQYGAVHFTTQENTLRVTTWENSLPLQFRAADRKEFSFMLPLLSTATLPQDATLLGQSEQLAKLRFSKLQKELQITRAVATAQDRSELRQDQESQESYAQSLRTDQTFSGNIAHFFRNILAFFPRTQAVLDQKNAEIIQAEFLAAAFAGDTNRIQEIAADVHTAPYLRRLYGETLALEEFFPQKDLRQVLEKELQKTAANSAQFTREVLRNAFSALKKSLAEKQRSWTELELAYIQNTWRAFSQADSASTALLPLERETLFHIFLEHPDQMTPELFAFLDFLDETEIKNAPLGEELLTKLEVIQKQLFLAKALISSKTLALAQDIMKKAAEKLVQLQQSASTQISLENMVKQQENIALRIYACQFGTSCSDSEFSQWYQMKKLAACQLDKACTPLEFIAWVQRLIAAGNFPADSLENPSSAPPQNSSPQNSFELAQETLDAAGITLISGTPREDGLFQVTKALTAQNIEFSAALSLDNGYFQAIVLRTGQEISGPLSITSLESAIARTLAQEPQDPDPTDNDLNASILDPSVGDFVIRTVQPELLDAGFVVLRTDMLAKSPTEVHVFAAKVGEDEIAVSFDYFFKKATNERLIRNVIFVDFPTLTLTEIPLAEAAPKIEEMVAKEKNRAKTISMAQALFRQVGLEIAQTNITLTTNPAIVSFTELRDIPHERSFSGEFNVEQQVFLILHDAERNWTGKNIPLAKYPELFAEDNSSASLEQVDPAQNAAAQKSLATSNP